MLKKSVIMVVLLAILCSCSMVLAAPYSAAQDTRHVEICIDLTQAWYNAFAAGDKQSADYIFQNLDKYNNHLISDNDAIAIIQKSK